VPRKERKKEKEEEENNNNNKKKRSKNNKSPRVGVTMESYGKVEISYINVDSF
jgi:hypothetical protein